MINSYWLYNKYKQLNNTRPVPYSNALNGYTRYAESLEKAKNLIGNEKVFSTYATALELTLGQFQPSGTDYIVHVLGDAQREGYINNFIQNKYKYVTTIKPSFSDYESWLKRANWFFYSELYKNYIPVMDTEYNTIWKRDSNVSFNYLAEINYKRIDDNTYEINVVSNNKSDIIADISLNYKSSYVLNLNRMLSFKHTVCIEDKSMANENTAGWCNYYIPIFLHNGEGKIKITSSPNKCTMLNIVDAKINQLLPNYYHDWDQKITIYNICDQNWNKGIKRDKNILLFEDTEFNRSILANAKQIKSNDIVKSINKIEYADSKWIWVALDDKVGIEEFAYPNKIEVIK